MAVGKNDLVSGEEQRDFLAHLAIVTHKVGNFDLHAELCSVQNATKECTLFPRNAP